MAKKKITEIVEEIMGDFLKENGFELYNTEFVKEGKDWFLRVYIDKAEALNQNDNVQGQITGSQQEICENEYNSKYISTDDCELVSRFLSQMLDEVDPIEQNYYLEVSSPGMDRTLTKEGHYKRYQGEQVEISLYKPLEGKKIIKGTLIELIDGNVVIHDEKNERIEMPLDKIAKTKLAVVF